MSKNYFKPSNYTLENAIMDAPRYGGDIYVGDGYLMRAHAGYVQTNIDADNDRGHISVDYDYNNNTVDFHDY